MSAGETFDVVELEPATTAVIRGTVAMDALPQFFDESFGALFSAIGEQGIEITGAAFARYFGPPSDTAELEVGVPTDRAIEAAEAVVASTLPAGRAAHTVHHGSFDELGESWQALMNWVTEEGLAPSGPFWEVYLTEPTPEMDPADLRTALYLPIG